ncbi:CLUMA_CG013360, isoform A [Clunio marinus]|uniref:CLUMA_CG013360, isoform A n=1 Tax=Clunio marinus TaxID=568069 RepID=A0A1J1IIL0_9DIPT|nr:CLUMA_CG013360, isoform A [Clunio marinus]
MSNGTTNLIGSSKPCQINGPLIVTIVGLPCHGKSLAAHKISRYLFWRGEDVKVFKVEDFVTEETLQNISEWFTTGHNVAIIDGMNLSKQSRNLVANYCRTSVYHHLIVEFNCTEACVEDNIKDTALFYEKLDNNKDWLKKLQERFKKFTPLYEKCSIHEGPLITVNNSENQLLHSVTAHGVQGLLQTFILGVLSSPVIKHRVFYFSRHGESEFNVLGRIGGDADLSDRGRKYADNLAKQLGGPGSSKDSPKPRLIWTSELRRTISTVQNIPGPRATLKDLNEINAGICEGLTYEEIQERFPSEFAWRDQDKLKYRYPHGESYLDLLQRVDGVIQALLLNTDVLVVSHQAVLRCIISYFKGTKPEEIPYINVPLHTLIIVKSYGYDFEIETVPLKVECVDTYRIQPNNCSIERTSADALTTVPAHFDSVPSALIN